MITKRRMMCLVCKNMTYRKTASLFNIEICKKCVEDCSIAINKSLCLNNQPERLNPETPQGDAIV
jgi:hypothetical protein